MNTTTLTRDELMAFISGCSVEKWELEMEFIIKTPDVGVSFKPKDLVNSVIVWHVIREFKS